MSILNEIYTLSNNVEIPKLGLGIWFIDDDKTPDAVGNKLRSLGVSNFLQQDLDNILEDGTVAPHVNQVLVHAGNTPSELITYCRSKEILVEAYTPIAHGEILNNERVAAIAKNYGVSVPQLCVRYSLQLGTVALPKTANPDHMRSNAEVDFAISEEDMDTLRDLRERNYGESSVFPIYSGK